MLKDFLFQQGYTRVKLKLLKTNHFEVKASINGVKGRFILDTGASNSCIDTSNSKTFKLDITDSDIKAAGAGATDMQTQISKRNIIKIGTWQNKKMVLILFNLIHVNTALKNHGANTVEGIIGADILKKGNAIIDYEKKYLYLKPLKF